MIFLLLESDGFQYPIPIQPKTSLRQKSTADPDLSFLFAFTPFFAWS